MSEVNQYSYFSLTDHGLIIPHLSLLVNSTRKTVSTCAKQMNMGESTLWRWLRKYRKYGDKIEKIALLVLGIFILNLGRRFL